MSRSLTADLADALAQDEVRPIHLVRVSLDDTTVYFTDAYKPIVFDGNTYTALGHFLGFDAIEETAKLVVNDTKMSISAIDQVYVALFLQEQYINRRCAIWLGVLGAGDALIEDPVQILEGRLDAPSIQEDPDAGTSVVSVSIINQWSDFTRKAGRLTNDSDQRALFPGDKGFQYAHQVAAPVYWGRLP